MAHQILVVDNEQFQGTLVSTVLKDHGYAVHFAQTVDEAIEVSRSRTFDLLLTDLRLPPGRALSELETKGGHETGIALARAIRELIPQIATIVYTAGPSEALRAQLGEHPFIKLFDKPALPEKIVRIVDETIYRERARPQMFIVPRWSPQIRP